MNVFAAFLWKEWRSQRALLAGYLALVWLSLALVLGILGTTNGVGSDAFTGTHFWCLATGLVGILGFAAPQTVRGELGGKDDQFLRRLPGALAPAFWSKAVFLVTATAAVVALACIIAWLLQIVLGVETPRLLGREFALLQGFLWAPLLLVPWVLAVAYWMPRGRMALGATVLLALLLGVAVWSLLRISPRLAETLSYSSLLWLCTPLALFVGCVSCACGRRGGGPARSAKLGGAALLVGLLPHGTWFGAQFVAYHWPDAERYGCGQVYGCTPDGRFALARVSADPQWSGVPFRIDLATGEAQQLGGWGLYVALNPFVDVHCEWHPLARHWFLRDWGRDRWELLDAVTGERQSVAVDAYVHSVSLPPETAATLATERRLQLDLPDGRHAWIEGNLLRWQRADGTEGQHQHSFNWVQPAGHAIVFGGGGTGFDFVHERMVDTGKNVGTQRPWSPSQCALRGCWLVRGWHGWRRIDGATDRVLPCCLSERTSMVTAVNDDEVLVTAMDSSGSGLGIYRIADDRLTPLVLPGSDERVDLHLRRYERDPRGRIWLEFLAEDGTHRHRVLDTRTHAVSLVRIDTCSLDPIAFVGDTALMLEDHRRIVRIDLATNARTVLFPRSERTETSR